MVRIILIYQDYSNTKQMLTAYTDWEEYSSIEYGQMNGSYNLITTFNSSYNGSKMSGYYVDEDVFYFDVLTQSRK